MIENVRPTMSMVKDLLPGMKESWIFNDCAIGEKKNGQFVGLVVVRIDEGDIFYGFINLKDRYSRNYTRETLDAYAENFRNYPYDLFWAKVTWETIVEGHRYA